MRYPLAFLFVAPAILALPLNVRAQWQVDGVPVSVAALNQRDPAIVSDGAGGAIVTYRSGASGIYVQRVSASGIPQWTTDGVALSTAGTTAGNQLRSTIVSDGAGGAIVAWADSRNGSYDIYVRRVDASGTPQWTNNGVVLCDLAGDQRFPVIASDGAGGAIVAWQDDRDREDIYAQRVNAAGAPQWTDDGVAISTADWFQLEPRIVANGAGGAIITWNDSRNSPGFDNPYYDIFAQRVDVSGATQWTDDGVALCDDANDQQYPAIVSDGASGAIVTWHDFRNGAPDIYARRVDASGAPQWTDDGVALCDDAGDQQQPAIVSDGAGGAIVTWHDDRNGPTDIYAQLVSAAGVPQWTADGVVLCAAANEQLYPTIVSDGAGGAIVTWYDDRTGPFARDIFAQRVDASGSPQWTDDGVALCAAANAQLFPMIVSDGAGGAIIAWEDERNGTSNSDIYAARVPAPATGVAGPTRGPSLIAVRVYPNPFAGTASIDIELIAPSPVRVEVFDVSGGRVRVMTLPAAAGSRRIEFDGRDSAGRLLPSGVYFYRVKAAGETATRKMVIAR